MKKILAAASLLLVAGSTSACGGDGAPTDASVDDFCAEYGKILKADDGKSVNEWADGMEEVGTPDDMTDEQREGFEVMMDKAHSIDEDASSEDLENEDEFKGSDKEKTDAFGEYVSKNCMDQLMPSDMPTEMPTDMPEMPSDMAS